MNVQADKTRAGGSPRLRGRPLANLFPNASQSTISGNPDFFKPEALLKLRGRHKMNDTEADFALILEAQKRNGKILRYEFEGITLRWADMRYTPDFVVFGDFFSIELNDFRRTLKLIEVKGAHIWSRDIVRFKGARAFWPEFAFEMWQKSKQGWSRKF
jgi:hypothetical protein